MENLDIYIGLVIALTYFFFVHYKPKKNIQYQVHYLLETRFAD